MYIKFCTYTYNYPLYVIPYFVCNPVSDVSYRVIRLRQARGKVREDSFSRSSYLPPSVEYLP